MNLIQNPYFGTGPADPSLIGWLQDPQGGYFEANHKPANLEPFGTALRMADAGGPGGGSFPYNSIGKIWQVIHIEGQPHAKVDMGFRQIQHSMPANSPATYFHKLLEGSMDGVVWVPVLEVNFMDSEDINETSRRADDWSHITYSTRNLPSGGYAQYRLTMEGRIASGDANSNVKVAEVHLVLDGSVQFASNVVIDDGNQGGSGGGNGGGRHR